MGILSGLKQVLAPVSFFFPPARLALMTVSVLDGLAKRPPDWKSILTNAVMAAVPLAMGKALAVFPGGTSAQFAELFSGKLQGTLGEVAKRVGNPQFTQLVTQMQSKLAEPAFLETTAKWVNAATKSNADEVLTADRIRQASSLFDLNTRSTLRPLSEMLTGPLMQGQSGFRPSQAGPMVLPSSDAGERLYGAGRPLEIARKLVG